MNDSILIQASDKLDALLAGATDGPWWFDESDQYWRLHGVHARIPTTLGGETFDQVINSQILKAPKSSAVFEPYWPTVHDGGLIAAMANPVVGRALSALFRQLAAHTDTPAEPILDVARAVLGESVRSDRAQA